ncbi:MAG: FAD-dependent oxidoreductase [Pseudomonadota bacterium]
MKIAIIGSGIAGNTIAHHLHSEHEITVFEAKSHIGGHTHTHDIELFGNKYAIDTGFIVFNDRTYPNFISMLDKLKVAWQPSEMSFSVHSEVTGLEYNGTSLNSLFAQRSNFFKPSFYGMIRDILRFNKQSLALLQSNSEIKLGDYLAQNHYKPAFINNYILPMGAAIWSTDAAQMLDFPARFLVRFFHHHGMLTVNDRPQWRTITGGSARYVEKLTEDFKFKIKLNSPIASVKRLKNSVKIKPLDGEEQIFDYVFFACHSDQALKILGIDATVQEREILGAIPYQENTVYLHHDVSLLPKRKLAWAAWNYHVTAKPSDAKSSDVSQSNKVQVTYNMNILQNIQSPQPILVTLNHTDFINPAKVIKRLKYTHPVYTIAGVAAQARHAEISGQNLTGYAGAYWLNGFHEDGVASALTALEHFQTHFNLHLKTQNKSD